MLLCFSFNGAFIYFIVLFIYFIVFFIYFIVLFIYFIVFLFISCCFARNAMICFGVCQSTAVVGGGTSFYFKDCFYTFPSAALTGQVLDFGVCQSKGTGRDHQQDPVVAMSAYYKRLYYYHYYY